MVNGKEGHVAGGGLESSGEIDSFILGGEVVANVISCARKWQKALSFSPGAPKSRRRLFEGVDYRGDVARQWPEKKCHRGNNNDALTSIIYRLPRLPGSARNVWTGVENRITIDAALGNVRRSLRYIRAGPGSTKHPAIHHLDAVSALRD